MTAEAEPVFNYTITVRDNYGNIVERFDIDGLNDEHAYEEATYEAQSDYSRPGWTMSVKRGERRPYDNTLSDS